MVETKAVRANPTGAGEQKLRRAGETYTSAIVDQLRQQIVQGVFQPDQRLRVRALAAHFGVGLSPVREALNRLSTEGLIRQNDLRGFSVAPVSLNDLEELTRTRAWLNERALRESIAYGDASWEESVVVAYHRLARQTRTLPDGMTLNPQWDAAHRAFHHQLIEGCRSRWLVAYCDQLFEIAAWYRNIARLSPKADRMRGDRQHRQIMEAAAARDADTAVKLLLEHFNTMMNTCKAELKGR